MGSKVLLRPLPVYEEGDAAAVNPRQRLRDPSPVSVNEVKSSFGDYEEKALLEFGIRAS